MVSAPAGYGKSTLVSQWTDSLDMPCAWLSLDSDDGDLTEFIQYVLDAIGSASATAARRSQRPSKTDSCNSVDTETWGS